MNPAAPDLSPALTRIATDERFMANLYLAWCGGALNLETVAQELRAPVPAIVSAGLCFRPRAGDDLIADVERIASHAGIEFPALLGFVRAAEALAAFKQAPEQARLLAAARDATENEDDE